MSLTLLRCVEIVNQEFGIDIRTKSRNRNYVIARQIYFYVARTYTDVGKHSLELIGKELSTLNNPEGWDHSTVLHNLKTMQNDISTGMYEDLGYMDKLNAIKTRVVLHANIDHSLISKEFNSISNIMDEFKSDFKLIVERAEARINNLKVNMKNDFLFNMAENMSKNENES